MSDHDQQHHFKYVTEAHTHHAHVNEQGEKHLADFHKAIGGMLAAANLGASAGLSGGARYHGPANSGAIPNDVASGIGVSV